MNSTAAGVTVDITFSIRRRIVTLQVEPVMCCTITKNIAPSAAETKKTNATR